LDGSVDELEIDLEDPNNYFGDFLSIGFGFVVLVEIGNDREKLFRSICEELWNTELLDSLLGRIEGDFHREFYISRLTILSRHPTMAANEMDFSIIAGHFYEFSVSDCRDFDSLILGRILSDSQLVIESEDSLFEIICDHISRDSSSTSASTWISYSLLENVRFEYLSETAMKSAFALICDSFEYFNISILRQLGNRLLLSVTPPILSSRFSVSRFDSKIISEFPGTIEAFGGKRFRLLYRGSRDGFRSAEFHRLCDGHGGTVTIIETTQGYIFGGYTPLSWQSGSPTYVRDDSATSFVFTIKNPHGLSARVFGLKEHQACNAISCAPQLGPTFGGGHDIHISDECDSSTRNYTNFDYSYKNETGVSGDTVFAGARNFAVRDIEVFEML
jgi:hypothetical protein